MTEGRKTMIERMNEVAPDDDREQAPGRCTIRENDLLSEILELPEWDSKEKRCLLTLDRKDDDKEQTYVVVVSRSEQKALDPKQSTSIFVPPETMPTWGFHEHEQETTTEDFGRAYSMFLPVHKRHLYFQDSECHNVLALGAMSTYFADVFNTFPYFDFWAAEPDCGKTTAMQALIWGSWQGFNMMDPTAPTLFRAIDSCNSAVGIDELDNKLIGDPKLAGDIIAVLNSGYKRGMPVFRVDTDRGMQVRRYDPFSLKAYTHRLELPESVRTSLRSRSIVFDMIQSPVKLPKLSDPAVFRDARDLMYLLGLTRQEDVRTAYAWVEDNADLRNRDMEIFSPLLTMAKLVSKETYDSVHAWAKTYIYNHAEDEIDDINRTIIEVLLDKAGNVRVTDIAADLTTKLLASGFIEPDKDGNPKWHYTTKTILPRLRSFGIKKTEYHAGNLAHVLIEPKTIRQWAERYGLVRREGGPLDQFSQQHEDEDDPVSDSEVKGLFNFDMAKENDGAWHIADMLDRLQPAHPRLNRAMLRKKLDRLCAQNLLIETSTDVFERRR